MYVFKCQYIRINIHKLEPMSKIRYVSVMDRDAAVVVVPAKKKSKIRKNVFDVAI